MKNTIRKSIERTILGFALIIIYCIVSILIKFNFLDLSYLVAVVVCFAMYIEKIRKIL